MYNVQGQMFNLELIPQPLVHSHPRYNNFVMRCFHRYDMYDNYFNTFQMGSYYGYGEIRVLRSKVAAFQSEISHLKKELERCLEVNNENSRQMMIIDENQRRNSDEIKNQLQRFKQEVTQKLKNCKCGGISHKNRQQTQFQVEIGQENGQNLRILILGDRSFTRKNMKKGSKRVTRLYSFDGENYIEQSKSSDFSQKVSILSCQEYLRSLENTIEEEIDEIEEGEVDEEEKELRWNAYRMQFK